MTDRTVTLNPGRVNQCQKPTGWIGRLVLWNMNSRHSKLTDWGLSYVDVKAQDIVLDVGCGGGRTVTKLAGMASEGKVYGIDYSKESVAFAGKMTRKLIAARRVEIQEASVSQLPFSEDMFNLVTAVETHFWWPDLPAGMREILRVLKPGGTLIVIAEVYKGANTTVSKLAEKYAPISGMKLLSVDEHRELFENAGYSDIHVDVEGGKGWICGVARKPSVPKRSV